MLVTPNVLDKEYRAYGMEQIGLKLMINTARRDLLEDQLDILIILQVLIFGGYGSKTNFKT